MSVKFFSVHCRAVTEEGLFPKLQMDQTLLCWSIWLTSGINNPQVRVRSVIHLCLLCCLRAVYFGNSKITAVASITPNLQVQLQPLWHMVCVTLAIHLISPYIILFFLFCQFWLYCLQGRGACCLSQYEDIQLLLLCKVNCKVKLLILNDLY